MKQRYVIPYRGLKEGKYTFEWRVGNDFWKDRLESGILGGDVAVEATLENGSTGVMRLTVSMAGNVAVSCDRCLEECSLPVGFAGELVVKTAGGELAAELEANPEAALDGEVLWLLPGDGQIDLEQYIYESIVLSLPLRRVHPEDVHGQPLCNPAMLERFRIVTEEEFNNLH